MAGAPVHLCQEVVVAAAVGVVGFLAVAAAVAVAPRCLGGAGLGVAPGAGLPAGRGGRAVGGAGAGLLLRKLALLKVGKRTENKEGQVRVSTSGLGWSSRRLPAIRMRTGPPSHPPSPAWAAPTAQTYPPNSSGR